MKTVNRVRSAREQRGLAASSLAAAAGVSRQTVYAIEAGDYSPNTTVALRLARALETTVERLFPLDEDAAPARRPRRVDLLAPAAPGQPVQVCRVGDRLVAHPASPQLVYLPPADGVLETGAAVRLFSGADPDRDRLLVAG